MDISLFDYPYPTELVAQHPLRERDASRLLVLDRKAGTWQHRRFKDFPDYFSKEDTLVFNDTKVFPARLYGKTKGGRSIEILLLKATAGDAGTWSCLVKPARRLADGDTIHFSETLSGTLDKNATHWSIRFQDAEQLERELPRLGLPPLPPYIKRKERCKEDNERYQTIYAEKVGSAAAPTAGFHFTPETLQTLKQKGCTLCYGTLHIGRDTFEPVRVQEITQHRMHGEAYEIPEATAWHVARGKGQGAKITAIGTTTVRALESAYTQSPSPLRGEGWGGGVRPGPGHTQAFFYPGYRFCVVDRLLTNFHQPKSTLLMLVAAFAGRELILAAYQDAIRQKYRLFSYGDAMFIL